MIRSRVLLCVILTVGCVRTEETLNTTAIPFQLPAPVLRSPAGMVVSGSPIASQVGADILQAGGNAVDAAVATAFALSVVEPTMSGLGGRTQILMRARNGQFHGIDGGTSVPRAYAGGVAASEDAYGYKTIGVPGTPAALALALERYGTLPLARVLEPAIRLARNGFVLSGAEAHRIAQDSLRLREFEASKRYFLKADGSVYRAGDRFIQSDLANTLEALAKSGVRVFYTGRIAEAMANGVRAHGGSLDVQDIQAYRAEEAAIARGSYRGYDLVGTYLPASGVTTIEALQIMENFELAQIVGSPRWLGTMTQALLLAFEDREKDFGSAAQKAAALVSKEHARTRAQLVRFPYSQRDDDWPHEPDHTTHLSVTDRHGGAVALTQSIGPNLGSRVAAPGLGFLFAATMGYLGDVRPGDRPFSSQSPLIALKDDQVRYVIGGAGARRIIPAIVAVLSRAIDGNMSLPDAMTAPRFHALPDRIDLEKRAQATWSAADSAALAGLGFNVRMRTDAAYFARIHAIENEPATRMFTGVADPRWQGAAAVPRN